MMLIFSRFSESSVTLSHAVSRYRLSTVAATAVRALAKLSCIYLMTSRNAPAVDALSKNNRTLNHDLWQ